MAGGITYLLRRWSTLCALLSAATAAVLALLSLRLPLDRSAFILGQEVSLGQSVEIGGRMLVLEPAGQVWMILVFALAAVLFLLAWRLTKEWTFYPFGLAMLSLYASVVLLQTFALQVLALALSVTLSAFIIQRGRHPSVRGAQRYLLVTLLSVPLLLAAGWLVDQSVLNSDGTSLARQAVLPAALGFGLLLAAFPFGTWIPAVTADAPSVVSAFVLTVGQAMTLFLLAVFLGDTPWVLESESAFELIKWAGSIMVVSGGIMAAVQRDLGRLFGYAALSDLGYVLLAFSIGGSQRLTLAFLHTANRSVAIILVASALAIVRQRWETDQYAALGGVAHQLPVAAGSLVLGGLALAGSPLTSGFATHWSVWRTLGGDEWLWLLLLLVATAGISIGVLRSLRAMLGDYSNDRTVRQPIIASMMVLALALLTLVLGVYPQLFLEPVQAAVEAFSFF
jgi:formate hydrogenlyase subunit 3/multisubunit Na+/H+ antiporter MnhD subunit